MFVGVYLSKLSLFTADLEALFHFIFQDFEVCAVYPVTGILYSLSFFVCIAVARFKVTGDALMCQKMRAGRAVAEGLVCRGTQIELTDHPALYPLSSLSRLRNVEAENQNVIRYVLGLYDV